MSDRPKPFDLSAMSTTGMALQKKAFEISQVNTQLTLDFVKSLMGCRTPVEAMNVTREFTSKQIEAFQNQAKELVDIASNKDM